MDKFDISTTKSLVEYLKTNDISEKYLDHIVLVTQALGGSRDASNLRTLDTSASDLEVFTEDGENSLYIAMAISVSVGQLNLDLGRVFTKLPKNLIAAENQEVINFVLFKTRMTVLYRLFSRLQETDSYRSNLQLAQWAQIYDEFLRIKNLNHQIGLQSLANALAEQEAVLKELTEVFAEHTDIYVEILNMIVDVIKKEGAVLLSSMNVKKYKFLDKNGINDADKQLMLEEARTNTTPLVLEIAAMFAEIRNLLGDEA